jgi:hypothetical protein
MFLLFNSITGHQFPCQGRASEFCQRVTAVHTTPKQKPGSMNRGAIAKRLLLAQTGLAGFCGNRFHFDEKFRASQ